jgi:hypothetical protein
VPERLDRGETLQLTLELVLEVEPNVSKAFDREVKRLRRKKRW